MKKTSVLCLLALLCLPVAALEIGDPAPALSADAWLNGSAVDPSIPDSNTIYVVEFWATWCPPCKVSIPHLNKLHDQYKGQGVIIVGVTDEPEEKVRPFMYKMDMHYRIALDTERLSYDTYMEDVSGIPHAFIIGRDGMVLWSGHPLADLEKTLGQILAGTYDPREAASLQQKKKDLQQSLKDGDLETAMETVDEILAIDPSPFELYQLKLNLLSEFDQKEEIPALYETMFTVFADSAEDLNSLAWTACTEDFSLCNLDIAYRAAQKAVELSKSEDCAILDTWARVHYAMGLLEDAARIQKDAINTATDPEEKKSLVSVLHYYESALSARDRHASPKENAP